MKRLLAEERLQGAPLLAEYAVPLECGPVLVSAPKGPIWVQPSKRSLVRAAPAPYLTDYQLVQELTQATDLVITLEELREDIGNLENLGWKEPVLEVQKGARLDLGVPVREVEYLPPGVRILAEKDLGFRGLRSDLDTGETLFKIHPFCSMRLVRGG